MKRWIGWIGGGLAVGVVCAAIGIVLMLRASLPDLDGELAVSGLSGEVSLLRDEQGLVTVQGQDLEGLAYGTGFAHGQDRFFQMDTLRRSAAGELAALFGPAALEFDRERRRWRGREHARATLAGLPESQQQLIRAYAEGVNAALDAKGARPPEYWLLRERPAPWEPEDSLLAGLSMFFYLTDAQATRDLRLDQMAEALPESVLDFLLDPADPYDAPLLPEALPILPSIPEREDLDARGMQAVELDPYRLLGRVEPLAGSNSWATASSLNEEGRAILAGDMHLGLALPNTWYRLRLENGDGLNLTGVSLPGVPGIIAGSNEHIAWAFTNSYGDWSTRVRMEWDGDDEERYLTPEGPENIQRHREVIEVRGDEDHVEAYRWSRWGPLLEENGEDHALVWTGILPGGLNLAFEPLLRAQTVEEGVEAAAGMGMPPQNIVMADADGRIAWTIAGRIPERQGWMLPGERLPVSSEFEFEGNWLAVDDYPALIDPPLERLWTANARVAGGEALDRIGDGGYPHGARQRQIRDRLFEMEGADEATLLDIQLDDEARLLHDWVTVAMMAADQNPDREGVDRFRHEVTHWHGHAGPESSGYLLLRDFRREVHGRVLGPLVHPVREQASDFNLRPIRKRERIVRQVLSAQPDHLLAPEFESWHDLLGDAIDAVVEKRDLERDVLPPIWGDINEVSIRHPMSDSVPFFSRWLDAPPVQLPGDAHVPRVQLRSFGASQRMVISPGQESEAIFHMPGGQSGHFLSPWYLDGHLDWEDGEESHFLPGEPAHELLLREAR